MGLSKDKIIEWRGKYNYPENEDGILNSIDSIKTGDDFRNLLFRRDGILKWKGALRTKHYYQSLDSSKWQVFFDIIKGSTTEPKETVKKIVAFSKENMSYNGKYGGISYPVASTIVYFFSKGNCPIIDWRVVFALKNNGYNERLNVIYLYYNKIIKGHQIYLDDRGWDNFYDLCHEIVSNLKIESIENDTPLRVLDKALWVFPDLEKNHVSVEDIELFEEAVEIPFEDIDTNKEINLRELYRKLETESLTKNQGYSTTAEQREENIKRVRKLADKLFKS